MWNTSLHIFRFQLSIATGWTDIFCDFVNILYSLSRLFCCNYFSYFIVFVGVFILTTFTIDRNPLFTGAAIQDCIITQK